MTYTEEEIKKAIVDILESHPLFKDGFDERTANIILIQLKANKKK